MAVLSLRPEPPALELMRSLLLPTPTPMPQDRVISLLPMLLSQDLLLPSLPLPPPHSVPPLHGVPLTQFLPMLAGIELM
jgi:hypothetical protein